MRNGKVVEWNDDRGFGFILPVDGGRKVFFHVSNYPQRRGRPQVGQECRFETVKADRGDKAVDISPITALDQAMGALNRIGLVEAESRMSWVALLFLAGVVALMIAGRVHPMVPLVYIVASLLSFSLYESDKLKAERGAWRIPEKRLHLLSLLGGWPGALMAQQRYRHKTQKAEFRTTFWTTVAVNCAALTVLSLFGMPSQASLLSIAAWLNASMGQAGVY
jgi:uncharacterized membrane protein YsdA (DUF1294 family)/cold shock CspA family protein